MFISFAIAVCKLNIFIIWLVLLHMFFCLLIFMFTTTTDVCLFAYWFYVFARCQKGCLVPGLLLQQRVFGCCCRGIWYWVHGFDFSCYKFMIEFVMVWISCYKVHGCTWYWFCNYMLIIKVCIVNAYWFFILIFY